MPEFFLQIHIFITQLYFYWNWLFTLKEIKEKRKECIKHVSKSKQCNFCNVLVQCTVYFCKQGKQGSVLYIYIFSFCKQSCFSFCKQCTVYICFFLFVSSVLYRYIFSFCKQCCCKIKKKLKKKKNNNNNNQFLFRLT